MWGATCTFTVTGTYQGGGNDTKLFARVAAGARGTTASRAAPKRTRRPSARRGEAQGARRRARRRSSTHCLSLATADRAAAQRIPGHLLLPSVGPRQNAAAPALLACWPACWMRPAACSRSDRAPSRIAPAACDQPCAVAPASFFLQPAPVCWLLFWLASSHLQVCAILCAQLPVDRRDVGRFRGE